MSDTEKKIMPRLFMPPNALCMEAGRLVPGGAMTPGDAFEIKTDERFIMKIIFYTTAKRIHGIWHHESPNQLFFAGYECLKCGEIYLIPDWVKTLSDLAEAMKHGCSVELP